MFLTPGVFTGPAHESNLIGEIGTGLKNFWYNLTGQTEKTTAYQALVNREDALRSTAFQTAAADMEAAGLSKYGLTQGASSNTRVGSDSDPIGKAMTVLQMRSVLADTRSKELDNEERRNNLRISKGLGIRTNDPNYASKWATLGNVLFGVDPTSVDGGLIPYMFHQLFPSKDVYSSGKDGETWINQFSFKDPLKSSVMPIGAIMAGASADQISRVLDNLSDLRSMDDVEKTKFIDKTISDDVSKTEPYNILKNLSFEDVDVPKLVQNMKDKGVVSEDVIERLADFISKRFGSSYKEVLDKIHAEVRK